MKILNLNITNINPLDATEKLIKAILEKDIKAFKNTKRQFIHNNPAYSDHFNGLIA